MDDNFQGFAKPIGESSLDQLDQKVKAFFDRLTHDRFWGAVTCKFEDGHPVFVKTEQGWKINELDLSGTPKKGGNGLCR